MEVAAGKGYSSLSYCLQFLLFVSHFFYQSPALPCFHSVLLFPSFFLSLFFSITILTVITIKIMRLTRESKAGSREKIWEPANVKRIKEKQDNTEENQVKTKKKNLIIHMFFLKIHVQNQGFFNNSNTILSSVP